VAVVDRIGVGEQLDRVILDRRVKPAKKEIEVAPIRRHRALTEAMQQQSSPQSRAPRQTRPRTTQSPSKPRKADQYAFFERPMAPRFLNMERYANASERSWALLRHRLHREAGGFEGSGLAGDYVQPDDLCVAQRVDEPKVSVDRDAAVCADRRLMGTNDDLMVVGVDEFPGS
jgi:hypothetical protein